MKNAGPTVNDTGALQSDDTSVSAGTDVASPWDIDMAIRWEKIPNPTPLDWIGLYVVGAADESYVTYLYTNGKTSGSVGSLTIPQTTEPGTYELRLFSNNGYTRLATSDIIGLFGHSRVSASRNTYRPGDQVKFVWRDIVHENPLDWIGLYEVGSADESYLAYVYTDGHEDGSGSLTIPAKTEPGHYELRLFSRNSYTRLANTHDIRPFARTGFGVEAAARLKLDIGTVKLGGKVISSWEGIPNPTSKDWIGLYERAAADESYITYVYTNGQRTGSTSLTVPAKSEPGSYELRLFSNNGYTRLATTGAISAIGAASLTASPLHVAIPDPPLPPLPKAPGVKSGVSGSSRSNW